MKVLLSFGSDCVGSFSWGITVVYFMFGKGPLASFGFCGFYPQKYLDKQPVYIRIADLSVGSFLFVDRIIFSHFLLLCGPPTPSKFRISVGSPK